MIKVYTRDQALDLLVNFYCWTSEYAADIIERTHHGADWYSSGTCVRWLGSDQYSVERA
jgi:hypothetical protein